MEKLVDKERLQKHIEALKKSYENIILILNQDIDSIEKDGVVMISLKDDKIRVYAQGQAEAMTTSNALLKEIEIKEGELRELEGKKPQEEKSESDDLSNRIK